MTMLADDVRWYYTGAILDGEPQDDPNLSLGGYRASSEIQGVIPLQPQNVTGVIIRAASLPNLDPAWNDPAGFAALTRYAPSSLSWQAPMSPAEGAQTPDTSPDLEDGASANRFARIEVPDPAWLPDRGTQDMIRLTRTMNGVFDDVSAAEATAGDIEYRCLCVRVEGANVDNAKAAIRTVGPVAAQVSETGGYAGAGEIVIPVDRNLDDALWPRIGALLNVATGEAMFYDFRAANSIHVPAAGRAYLGTAAAGGTHLDELRWRPMLQVGIEAPIAGKFTLIGSESVPPAGVVFSNCWDDLAGDPLPVIGALGAGDIYGVWVKRIIVAGAPQSGRIMDAVSVFFDE